MFNVKGAFCNKIQQVQFAYRVKNQKTEPEKTVPTQKEQKILHNLDKTLEEISTIIFILRSNKFQKNEIRAL